MLQSPVVYAWCTQDAIFRLFMDTFGFVCLSHQDSVDSRWLQSAALGGLWKNATFSHIFLIMSKTNPMPIWRGSQISRAWVPLLRDREFNSRSNQTNDITLILIASWPGNRRWQNGARTGYLSVKVMWLSRKLGRWTDFPVEQHYGVAMSAQCHNAVPILTWPLILRRY